MFQEHQKLIQTSKTEKKKTQTKDETNKNKYI